MATSSRKYSVPALHLCICSVVILCFLTADVTAALHRQPRVVVSTEAFYLRGNPSVKAEAEESYESFERRELAEYNDSSANCSANCDVP